MTTLRRRLSWPAALQGRWQFCGVLALTAAVLTFWPDAQAWLRYDRAAISAGQYWRVISAHLVHLNGVHLLLNVAGLFLLCELLWNDMPVRHAVGLLVGGGFAVCAMLLWVEPQLAWYAGLSGTLHGLWAGCALSGLAGNGARALFPATPTSRWRRLSGRWPLQRCISLAGLLLLVLKLLVEAYAGASARTIELIGAPVVTQAHLYGAFGGGLYMLFRQAWPGTGRRHLRR